MNCKKIEGLIFTDYLDGNLSGQPLEEVETHIRSCPDCNALAQEVKAAGKLFIAFPRQEAPSKVWDGIRAGISAEPARSHFLEDTITYARYYLSHLKPAVVIASAVVLLFFTLTAIRLMPHKDHIEAGIAQDDILAISYTGEEENGSEYDFGTPVEMFFL